MRGTRGWVMAAALAALCAACSGGGPAAGDGSAGAGNTPDASGTAGKGGASGAAGASGGAGASGAAGHAPDGGAGGPPDASSDGPVPSDGPAAGPSCVEAGPAADGASDRAPTDGAAVDAADALPVCVDPFLGAMPIVIGGALTSGTLDEPAKSKAYFSFSGTKGQVIAIDVTTLSTLEFPSSFLDPVLTLYDARETQIARIDDPWPRLKQVPTLYTVLPATGTYYAVVADCNAVYGTGCYKASEINIRSFKIRVRDLDDPTVVREGSEPANDAAAGAPTIGYLKMGATDYARPLLFGVHQTATDTDTFGFTVPADTPVKPGWGRPRVSFWIQPSGPNGNGSTAAPGAIYIVDPSDASGAHLAEIDGTTYGSGLPGSPTAPAQLSAPIELGHRYNLVVKHGPQAAGANDFYFITHAAGLLELGAFEEGDLGGVLDGNTSLMSTYNLPASTYRNVGGTDTFVLDGEINPAGDVDVIALIVNQPTLLTGACEARRRGSGLTGLTYELVKKTDRSIVASQTESPTTTRGISVMVEGTSDTALRISATGQLPNVKDRSYVCRFDTAN